MSISSAGQYPLLFHFSIKKQLLIRVHRFLWPHPKRCPYHSNLTCESFRYSGASENSSSNHPTFSILTKTYSMLLFELPLFFQVELPLTTKVFFRFMSQSSRGSTTYRLSSNLIKRK